MTQNFKELFMLLNSATFIDLYILSISGFNLFEYDTNLILLFEIINNKHVKLDCSKILNNKIKFVSYSNKLKPEINKIYKSMNVSEFKRMKSSLKFCVIASNEYDGYVAEPRACEWDIAAGHAILENAGGIVTDFEGNEILYGKENFKNPSIILKRNKNI